jgi:hypothetical protein
MVPTSPSCSLFFPPLFYIPPRGASRIERKESALIEYKKRNE